MFKSLLIAIAVVVGMYMTVEIFYNQDVVVEKEVTTEVETIEVEQDAIEKAKQDLERINAELDTEEAKILEERKALDARLEKIREARLGFQ
jgi:tRNA(Phe) wybutosine-synthesizing methylase Tyw3